MVEQSDCHKIYNTYIYIYIWRIYNSEKKRKKKRSRWSHAHKMAVDDKSGKHPLRLIPWSATFRERSVCVVKLQIPCEWPHGSYIFSIFSLSGFLFFPSLCDAEWTPKLIIDAWKLFKTRNIIISSGPSKPPLWTHKNVEPRVLNDPDSVTVLFVPSKVAVFHACRRQDRRRYDVDKTPRHLKREVSDSYAAEALTERIIFGKLKIKLNTHTRRGRLLSLAGMIIWWKKKKTFSRGEKVGNKYADVLHIYAIQYKQIKSTKKREDICTHNRDGSKTSWACSKNI